MTQSRTRIAKATATPSSFAAAVHKGWMEPRHVAHLNRCIVGTVQKPDGRLIVAMPPRSGKSMLVSHYSPAWFVGCNPDLQTILCSYEADFAASWGRKARTVLEEHGNEYFGVTVDPTTRAANRWQIKGHTGGMMTAGAGGPITGKGFHLGIVDDPFKNAEEAASETIRSKVWEWYQSTFRTRAEPDASIIVVATRWHEDDLTGRLLADMAEGGEEWQVVNFPAVAEEFDVLGREPGEPLWPERYSLAALKEIRRSVGAYYWAALYQGTPTPADGGVFSREWFPIQRLPHFDPKRCTAIRYWDKAASTKKGSDYSVGALLVECDGLIFIVDVKRGRWSSHKRETTIKATIHQDRVHFSNIQTFVEVEPGSSGIDSAQSTVRSNLGQIVRLHRPTGDKETRARPLSAYAEAGLVRICPACLSYPGTFHEILLHELEIFPNGRHDDQVDAASGAFNRLAEAVSLGVEYGQYDAPQSDTTHRQPEEVPLHTRYGGKDWGSRFGIPGNFGNRSQGRMADEVITINGNTGRPMKDPFEDYYRRVRSL